MAMNQEQAFKRAVLWLTALIYAEDTDPAACDIDIKGTAKDGTEHQLGRANLLADLQEFQALGAEIDFFDADILVGQTDATDQDE